MFMKTGGFDFTEENFLKLEQVLAARRPGADDLWTHRVSLFCHMADTAYAPKEKRFRFGLLSYSVWMLLRVLTTKRLRVSAPPPADFLVHIVGNVSKETDTLAPVVTALCEAGQTVLVLWGAGVPATEEVVSRLNGATVWTVPGLTDWSAFHPFLARESFSTARQLWRTFLLLRPLKGARRALWRCSAWWFHDLLQLKCWERLLVTTLTNHRFKGVAVVSETASSAEALCRVAANRGWPVHHFLHGLPGFYHTRPAASDIHCFSRVECDYFIGYGHPPDRVHATGHPRQSAIAGQIKKLRTIPPEQGGLRILFASQPSWFETDDEDYRKNVRAVLEAATKLQLKPCEIRVRLHPVEDRQAYLALAKQYAPHFGSSILSNYPVAEDLAWANILITSFSTMAMEASYAGCLLVWLAMGKLRFEVREKLTEHGYGCNATSGEQLYLQLLLCRDATNRSRFITEQMAKAADLGILNSSAARAAADCMINVAQNQLLTPATALAR